MKLAAKLQLLISLATTFAYAQTQLPHFDNIIIVFQENRTPDNLFGSVPSGSPKCGQGDPFETGVDIANCGDQGGNQIWLSPRSLGNDPTNFDPNHAHYDFVRQCDLDPNTHLCKMDGACTNCFSYVPESDVDPYFQIAENYGFANYMFQTNEGPSFPAHQFIISGTSAPSQYPNGNYSWFDADNTSHNDYAGCLGPGVITPLIDNTTGCENQACNTQETAVKYCENNPTDPHCVAGCFSHNSLVSLWDKNKSGNGWQYFLPPGTDFPPPNQYVGIWNGPVSISDICQPEPPSAGCTNPEYNRDMVFETSTKMMPILDYINNCELAPVNWVIPDALWSDHAKQNNGTGPDYVAAIVNAVGNNTTCGADGKGYWYDDPNHSVAIFITWDDWGGWFDHVNPSVNAAGQHIPGVNQTPGTWGAFYTYGFRVPLLVVSPFTAVHTISGACGTAGQPSCPNQVFPYVHDFGSILNFIETNFALPIGQIGPTQWRFADFWAPDYSQNVNIPLQEFFETNGVSTWRPFTPINPISKQPGYFQTNGTLEGPDAEDDDD